MEVGFSLYRTSFAPISTGLRRSFHHSTAYAPQPIVKTHGQCNWRRTVVSALVGANGTGGQKPKATVGGVGMSGGTGGVPTTNYVVPLGSASSGITRPLVEILRDLNKRVPDNIINSDHASVPWYHANRMLSFYAPGWCGEVRDVIFLDGGLVTVIYRVVIRGTDGEAHRDATGTACIKDGRVDEAVTAAEESAFCKACARFGFGLYLYHHADSP
ncbi:DNA repair RAD52-like protein 2, chloroplastic [Carex rostrata]